MNLGYLHLKNRKISYRQDLGPFGVLTLFGTQKLHSLITLQPAVRLVWNLAGFSLVMISKSWYGPKFLILPLNGPMGMGQFWVPESAVRHKWSNFQPFGFKFGLYSLLLGISTWKTEIFHMGLIWGPFGVMTLFGTQKLKVLITMEIAL